MGEIGWAKGEEVREWLEGGSLEKKPRGGESREAGRERGRGGMDNSGRPELPRAIQLPGFFSAQSQGFWGPLPPGSPPLPSRARGWVSGSPPRATLSPWTQRRQREAQPSFRKGQGKDAKEEIKCKGGKGRGRVRKGCQSRAAVLTTLPRGQAGDPRAPEVRHSLGSGPGSCLSNPAHGL